MFGWGWYYGPQWPTADHFIPWYDFLWWTRRIGSLRARERLSQFRALVMAETTSDQQRQRLINSDIDEAYPDGG